MDKKENVTIKEKTLRDIKTLVKKDDYLKSIKVGYFWNNNYIEHESDGDRNKNLSIRE